MARPSVLIIILFSDDTVNTDIVGVFLGIYLSTSLGPFLSLFDLTSNWVTNLLNNKDMGIVRPVRAMRIELVCCTTGELQFISLFYFAHFC